jgi:hypothetical protein
VDAVGVRLGRVEGNADGGARAGAGARALGNGGVSCSTGDSTVGYDGWAVEVGVSAGFVLRLLPFDNVLMRCNFGQHGWGVFSKRWYSLHWVDHQAECVPPLLTAILLNLLF